MKPFTLCVLICCFGLTGCLQTRQNTAEQLAQQKAIEERQRQQQLTEQRKRFEMQLEDTDVRLQESQQGVQEIRSALNAKASNADIRALENRIAALEQMIQRMEVQRTRDRDEMVKTISQRMASIMAQQQAARQQAASRVHTVSSGETLGAIADAYGVRSQRIIQANNIQNPNALRVGQRLTIPGN